MSTSWTTSSIAGKPVSVFDPPNALPFTLLWLHDESGTLPPIESELAARRLRCIAPVAGRSWWVDRVCAEFDPVLTAERFILDHVVQSSLIAVAGIGMGGQGAIRLGLRHPPRFPVVASLDGAMDFHERYGRGTPLDDMYPTREHARQDTAILHVPAHEWPAHIWFGCSPASPWHRGNDRLHEKLAAVGVPHAAELDRDPAIGELLTFVVAALERESRRLK